MSEMVERVREAIRLALHDVEEDVCVHEMTVAELDGIARAAIEAMREPTDEMKRVLASAAKHGTEANGDLWPGKLMGELIDAALTTSPST